MDSGNKAIVKLLLEKGVDLETRDSLGRTPLYWAVLVGYEAIMKLLLKKGVDLNKIKDGRGRIALFTTVVKGYEAIVKLLLEKGVDPETRDSSGRTLLS